MGKLDNKKVFVTRSHLPSKDRYFELLDKIWDSNQLTNNGQYVRQLENELTKRLNTELVYVNNGTIAIQIAIKALELKGEIITTPFSYVATTSSIVWENCIPIFVDIEPEYLTIDPKRIEEKITPKTKAILATHVFGNPCDVESLETIASKHNLKIIYDAAHSFDVTYKSKNISKYGDISTFSFHATKVFHTAEGGGIAASDPEVVHKLKYLRNFGHNGQTDFFGIGINGKCSEFHAAMGIAMLEEMNFVLEKRKESYIHYCNQLSSLENLKIVKIRPETKWNYAYFPVLISDEYLLQKLLEHLKTYSIYPRRYFYPSLNKLPYVQPVSCPISEDSSSRILCLPFWAGMEPNLIERISHLIKEIID